MHLLYAFLVLLSLSDGFHPTCPSRCSCDSLQSVQCYRITEVPSALPSTTKKLYISHSKIPHLQVTIPCSSCRSLIFLRQGEGGRWGWEAWFKWSTLKSGGYQVAILGLTICLPFTPERGICLWVFLFRDSVKNHQNLSFMMFYFNFYVCKSVIMLLQSTSKEVALS